MSRFIAFAAAVALAGGVLLGAAPEGKEDPPVPAREGEIPADVEEFFQSFDPGRLAELKGPPGRGPKSFEERLAVARREMQKYGDMKRIQPEEFDLRRKENLARHETARALERLRNADTEAEREAAEQAAREAVAKTYEIEVGRQEREVKQREDELRYAKRRLQVWKDHRDLVVESRLAEFLGNKGFFVW